MSAFIDSGGVFTQNDYSGTDTQYKQGEMRYSAGIGLMWNSPFGPLAISFAEPLNEDSTDRIQRFQFGMGSAF
jgi:outer membrane protein insertion porin family